MSEDQQPEVPQRDSEGKRAEGSSQGLSRRQFLRRNAEAAAVALFGVVGLDEVANLVVSRLRERLWLNRVSDAAALRLGSAHFGAAWADAPEPPGPPECGANPNQQGVGQSYDCPSDPLKFNHRCQSAGYHCWTPNLHGCGIGPNPDPVIFACGDPDATDGWAGGEFHCGTAGQDDPTPFGCDEEFDFVCYGFQDPEHQIFVSFSCDAEAFECKSGHGFACQWLFRCQPEQPGGFRCNAGDPGAQCNQPGWGGYTIDGQQPDDVGDFVCSGATEAFVCAIGSQFTDCTLNMEVTGQDFYCIGKELPEHPEFYVFACLDAEHQFNVDDICGTMNGYPSPGQSVFACVPKGMFVCAIGTTFLCSENAGYAP